MTDVFDEELRRAIKAGMQEELKGLAFTPAMRRQVMERIRAEDSGTDSSPRSGRGPSASRFVRPLAVAAAAAAALLVMTNTGLDGFKMNGQSSGSDLVAKEAERAAPAQAPGTGEAQMLRDSGQMTQQEPSPDGLKQSVAEADGIEKQAPGGSETPHAMMGAAEPADAAGASVPAGEPDARVDVSIASAVPEPAAEADVSEDVAAASAAPEPAAGANVPVGDEAANGEPEVSIAMVPEAAGGVLDHQGYLVSLPVPAMPQAETANMLLMAAAPQGDVEAPAPGNCRVERTEQGVRLVDASGAVLWERTLAGPEGPGQLAVSPAGRIAVSFGGDLYILDSRGETEQLLHLPEMPLEVAWAGDVMLAVADFSGVTVYREGAALWSAPVFGEGLAAFGDLLLVWSGDQMTALELPEGREAWRAAPEQAGASFERVEVSPDGRLAALLASLDGGWVLWVVDAQGQVLLTEGLPKEPAVTFQADAVQLELPGEVRSLPLSQ